MTVHENAQTRRDEADVAADFAEAFQCEVRRLKDFNELDFAMVNARDRNVVCIVEVKCRAVRMHAYRTYMLSLHKWMALKKYDDYSEHGCVLVVRWSDRTGYLKVREFTGTPNTRWGGRNDRGTSDDEEPVVDIPISAFTVMT